MAAKMPSIKGSPKFRLETSEPSLSVAFTGMIGFVGLIAPHTVRLLTKSSSNTKLIPLSTLGGGLFLLICDTIGRTLLSPIEIPIGVVTAFFGAPFFLYLAMKRKKGG